MYQFTTTNVINSQYVKDYDGNDLLDSTSTQISKYTSSATALTIQKVGKFLATGIVSIYKRPYSAAVNEVAHVTIPAIATGKVGRIEIILNLTESTQSEYVNYALEFKKPIVVEIIGTNSAAGDAALMIAQLNALKTRFGQRYFTVAIANTSDAYVTCLDPTVRVKSIKVYAEPATYTSNINPEYTDVTAGTFHIATPGSIGFGNDTWMLRRIMLQTAENTRAFGISKEERPILGANYTEYTLRYSITKDGTDGTSAGASSITTHVFYVTSALQAAFETVLLVAHAGIITIDTDYGLTITGDQTIAANTGQVYTIIGKTTAAATLSLQVYTSVACTSATHAIATVTGVGGSASTNSAVSSSTGNTFLITKVGTGNVWIKVWEDDNTSKYAIFPVVVS